MDLEVSSHLTIPSAELRWKFTRSSGPGGQHVNTSASRVQLTWSVTESAALSEDQRALLHAVLESHLVAGTITVTVSEQRSQLRNRQVALVRLRALLRDALAPSAAVRRATRPTRGSARRHLAAKRERSVLKQQRQRPADE
jgi:ribosome-associated protein